ncbi:hypothetical protein [Methylomicrobium agile]|uniref:hypothetical protein n=1 Tax=Methylomicrobium agile TaxID=39774 RepID=UPI0004DFAE06|nr:hypothetical protein [Methylomicrobium agile]
MTALQRIKRAGFEVSLSGDTFTVSPASRLTPEQREFLKAHKAEIVKELSAIGAPAPATDGRHHCRECLHFASYHAHGGGAGICNAEVMPYGACHWADTVHQCGKYLSSASDTKLVQAPSTDPLLVEVWTPSGTPMTIRADNAGHAEWLRKMNPKPESPAPKPDPAPRGQTISEAAHNAQGRYFKFLATWPDGRQCYLCAMPRQTLSEVRAQYPTATHIEPILNEDYTDDEI